MWLPHTRRVVSRVSKRITVWGDRRAEKSKSEAKRRAREGRRERERTGSEDREER